ncbi:MAG: nitrite reductase small subunit NirD [Pseudomonadota bacterium]
MNAPHSSELDTTEQEWLAVCSLADLQPGAGVAILHADRQFALFYLPEEEPNLFAIGNFDPIGKAHVLSRGVVGDVKGELCVASPLYKQHFRLRDGGCIEQPEHSAGSTAVKVKDATVYLPRIAVP